VLKVCIDSLKGHAERKIEKKIVADRRQAGWKNPEICTG